MKSKDIKGYRDEQYVQQGSLDPIARQATIDPVLDHDHDTGRVRAVLDRDVNRCLGKIENAFKRFIQHRFPGTRIQDFLRNSAEYLEHNWTGNPVHPSYIALQVRRFSRHNIIEQRRMLTGMGVEWDFEMKKKDLARLYRKALHI